MMNVMVLGMVALGQQTKPKNERDDIIGELYRLSMKVHIKWFNTLLCTNVYWQSMSKVCLKHKMQLKCLRLKLRF